MRKVSMATRAELILAIRGRYASAGRPEKAKILGEFVALTGFHRKHAMRLLRGSDEPAKGGARLGAPDIWRRGARRSGVGLGGVGPDLWQAAAPLAAAADRSDGAPRARRP